MKSTATKLTAVVLAASMALSFAACSKSGKSGGSGDDRETSHSGEKISASTPWFNSKITTLMTANRLSTAIPIFQALMMIIL